MITREMVEQAYEEDIIKLIDSPNDDGTVCEIGDHWFYFDMIHGEDFFSVSYKENFTTGYILDRIYDALESMRLCPDDYSSEYAYYESYILVWLDPKHKKLTQMRFVAKKISEILDWTSKAKCEYIVMNDDYLSTLALPQLACDSCGHNLIKDDEYMIITCSNGYKYYINVTADSVLAACAEVFNFIQNKL